MMKNFIITIDTEGDNLWSWSTGCKIKTDNTKYLLRFQKLCEDYGFKPVWLTNYEMISDSQFVDFACNIVENNMGEIGMHLHAWNTPPIIALKNSNSIDDKGYLIEYPEEVMDKKIKTMTDLITDRIGIKPITHRAGRWAMNDKYFELIAKYGYKVDCSYTPHVNWQSSKGENIGGCDYSRMPEGEQYINTVFGNILEVPVTIRTGNYFIPPDKLTLRNIYRWGRRIYKNEATWIRPNGYNLKSMIKLSNEIIENPNDKYIMFMLHSSELMPGGSPTFKSSESIENLYNTINILFKRIADDCKGITLKEYYFEKR